MPATTVEKPAAKSTKAKGTKAKAAPKAKASTLTAGQVATVEAWDQHRKARKEDSSIAVDVDLARKIKLINPKAKFDADETAAIKVKTDEENKNAALREPSTGTSAGASKASSKGKGKGRAKKTGKPGFRAAAEQVLREADGPMHVKDITEQVLARKMTDTKGGATPVAAMYVQLHQASRKGSVVKVGPSIFDLTELNPKGAKKRPTGK